MTLHAALKGAVTAFLYIGLSCGAHAGRRSEPASAVPATPPVPPVPPVAAMHFEAVTEGTLHYKGRLSPGARVDVRIVDGAIRAVGASGDEVEIDLEVKRGGVGRAPRIAPHEGGVRVLGRGGEVDVVVRLPAGARLQAHSVNGGVRVQGVRDVDVHVVNGTVEIAHAGGARARSVNGSIRASFDAADPGSAADLSTVNGDVDVTLPPNTGADVDARSVSGSIALAGPPINVVGPHHLHTVVGGGGRALHLRTVTGRISVENAKP